MPAPLDVVSIPVCSKDQAASKRIAALQTNSKAMRWDPNCCRKVQVKPETEKQSDSRNAAAFDVALWPLPPRLEKRENLEGEWETVVAS